jgi:hypothetical protein
MDFLLRYGDLHMGWQKEVSEGCSPGVGDGWTIKQKRLRQVQSYTI